MNQSLRRRRQPQILSSQPTNSMKGICTHQGNYTGTQVYMQMHACMHVCVLALMCKCAYKMGSELHIDLYKKEILINRNLPTNQEHRAVRVCVCYYKYYFWSPEVVSIAPEQRRALGESLVYEGHQDFLPPSPALWPCADVGKRRHGHQGTGGALRVVAAALVLSHCHVVSL